MLRSRQRLGKYRIDGLIGRGGFANVYKAYDTIEGTRVALKIPHPQAFEDSSALVSFRNEARLAARLDHPGILSIKNAAFIDDHFVIVYPLGERSLADRLKSRMAMRSVIDYIDQMLESLAYAHRRRIVHCDVKPENFLLFAEQRIRLADFGIAKVAQRTLNASGTGTVGFIAPEQAMGKPSLRSDVFSMGLVMYRMVSGELPEWPFSWPPPGIQKARTKLHPDVIALIRRCLHIDPSKRYADATRMLAAWKRLKPKALAFLTKRRRKSRTNGNGGRDTDWKAVRYKQFQKTWGKTLGCRANCSKCQGPVSEAMLHCPWCGVARDVHRGETTFPRRCRRCRRGMKLDWRFCGWCYGPGSDPEGTREYTDVRYSGRCDNAACTRRVLMPFQRYCAWCRRKVRQKWKIPGSRATCGGCGWGHVPDYWGFCPWCGRQGARTTRSATGGR